MIIIHSRNWRQAQLMLPLFLPAALETLKITYVSILLGVLIGLAAAFCRISKTRILNWLSTAYITVIRGTPILLQLFIIYFGLTGIIKLDDFPAAVIALGFTTVHILLKYSEEQ